MLHRNILIVAVVFTAACNKSPDDSPAAPSTTAEALSAAPAPTPAPTPEAPSAAAPAETASAAPAPSAAPEGEMRHHEHKGGEGHKHHAE